MNDPGVHDGNDSDNLYESYDIRVTTKGPTAGRSAVEKWGAADSRLTTKKLAEHLFGGEEEGIRRTGYYYNMSVAQEYGTTSSARRTG
jgi:hypothetical protein